jgi:hypothetical protein
MPLLLFLGQRVSVMLCINQVLRFTKRKSYLKTERIIPGPFSLKVVYWKRNIKCLSH